MTILITYLHARTRHQPLFHSFGYKLFPSNSMEKLWQFHLSKTYCYAKHIQTGFFVWFRAALLSCEWDNWLCVKWTRKLINLLYFEKHERKTIILTSSAIRENVETSLWENCSFILQLWCSIYGTHCVMLFWIWRVKSFGKMFWKGWR